MNLPNHEKFLVRFDESHTAVWYVARWIWEKKNLDVTFPKVKKSPTADQWEKYIDGGDLIVEGKRIEVKHYSCIFTNASDIPYKDFFVCAKHSFDNAKEKPLFYFIVNGNMTRAAVVDCSKCDRWYTKETTDKYYGKNYKQVKYCCPKEDLLFITLR